MDRGLGLALVWPRFSGLRFRVTRVRTSHPPRKTSARKDSGQGRARDRRDPGKERQKGRSGVERSGVSRLGPSQFASSSIRQCLILHWVLGLVLWQTVISSDPGVVPLPSSIGASDRCCPHLSTFSTVSNLIEFGSFGDY